MDPECERKFYNNDTPLVPTPLPLGVPSHGQYLDDDNKQSYTGNKPEALLINEYLILNTKSRVTSLLLILLLNNGIHMLTEGISIKGPGVVVVNTGSSII